MLKRSFKIFLIYLMSSVFTVGLSVIIPITATSTYVNVRQNGLFGVCFVWLLMMAANVHVLCVAQRCGGMKTCLKNLDG